MLTDKLLMTFSITAGSSDVLTTYLSQMQGFLLAVYNDKLCREKYIACVDATCPLWRTGWC